MAQVEQKRSKFTFGNILLTLLVLGTFAVIGLMVKLYIELTKTPEKTVQMHQEQEKQKIEVMSPNAQPGDKLVYRDATQAASKPVAQTQQQVAANNQAAASGIGSAENKEEFKEAALHSGAAPAKKAAAQQAKKVAKTAEQEAVELKPINTVAGEVQLKPTNIQPAANTTRNNASAETGERKLKPQPRNVEKAKSREAIDELF